MFEELDNLFKNHAPLQISGEQSALHVAVTTLLVEAAVSNDEFHESQLEKAVQLTTREFNIKDHEAGELLDVVRLLRKDPDKVAEFYTFCRENLSEDQRVRLLSMVWKIVLADGVVDLAESQFAAKCRREMSLTMEQAVLAQKMAQTPQ